MIITQLLQKGGSVYCLLEEYVFKTPTSRQIFRIALHANKTRRVILIGCLQVHCQFNATYQKTMQLLPLRLPHCQRNNDFKQFDHVNGVDSDTVSASSKQTIMRNYLQYCVPPHSQIPHLFTICHLTWMYILPSKLSHAKHLQSTWSI